MCWLCCQLCNIHWKIKLLQEVFHGRFSYFSKEDRMFVFINHFHFLTSHSKMPSTMQMERIWTNSKFSIENEIWWTFIIGKCVENYCFITIITMWTFSKNEKICPESCLSLRNNVQMRAVIFFHENNQKQTEVTTVWFQLEKLSVAFCFECNSKYYWFGSKAESKVTLKSFVYLACVQNYFYLNR